RPLPRRGARMGRALPRRRERSRRGASQGRRDQGDGHGALTAMEDTRGTIEAVARSSYGRLLAYLCSATRDVPGAEDALGEALLSALASWPIDGLPPRPAPARR